MPRIITARVERQGDTNLYRVVINHDGAVVLEDESFTVCDRVACALVRDEGPTELQDLADNILRWYANQPIEKENP